MDTWYSFMYQNLFHLSPFDEFYFHIFFRTTANSTDKRILENTSSCLANIIFGQIPRSVFDKSNDGHTSHLDTSCQMPSPKYHTSPQAVYTSNTGVFIIILTSAYLILKHDSSLIFFPALFLKTIKKLNIFSYIYWPSVLLPL